MIAAGYEDGIDANALRSDPVFKMALERLPAERDLCSQSTVSRLENLPDARMLLRMGAGHGRALLRLLCPGPEADHARHRRHLRRRAWRPAVAAVQRPLRRLRLPADRRLRRRGSVRHRRAAPGEAAEGRRDRRPSAPPDPRDPEPLAAGGDPAPRRRPLLRARSARSVPRARRGLRLRPAHHQRAAPPCGRARGIHRGPRRGRPGATATIRRFKEFHDAAASWSRVERIVARVEAGPAAAIPASSSPASPTVPAGRSTRTSTAPAVRPRTTSRRGRPTSPPTAPRAPAPPPTSSGCSCMPAPTG